MRERKISRRNWGNGPWDTEPDRIEWRYMGYPCLIVRNHLGALCGYVAVNPGHPWYGLSEDIQVKVHGGITFTGPCDSESPICHTPMPGEPDDVWWVGFDCAHGGDLVPSFTKYGFYKNDSYRTVEYVQSEIQQLVAQAIQAAK